MNDTWWDPRKNPLVAMNPVRVQFIVESVQTKIRGRFQSETTKDGNAVAPTSTSRRSAQDASSRPLNGLEVLDVGCGGGLLSNSLARLGAATVTAIDPSVPLVERAKQQSARDAQTSFTKYMGGVTIEDLAAAAGSSSSSSSSVEPTSLRQKHSGCYDVICILEVLEHATDVDSMLRAASTLLKRPHGLLFVSTINKTWKSHLVTIVGAEYVMRYLPIGTHDWNSFQSPLHVRERMHRVGLEEVDVTGMVVTAPRLDGTWAWKLDANDTDVNWIGCYQHARDAPRV